MKVGDIIHRRGCVTLFKFIAGCTIPELERRIGYHSGRLANGAFLAQLLPGQLVQPADIQLLGYSQVAEHRFKDRFGDIVHDHDLVKLTKIALGSWEKEGLQNIVKVLPITEHDNTLDNDSQYPSGTGIAQWKLVKPLDFQVVKFIERKDQLLLT